MAFEEKELEMDAAHIANVFGQFDRYVRKLERAFSVTIVDRDGAVKVRGEEERVNMAVSVLAQLLEISKRGNQIQ